MQFVIITEVFIEADTEDTAIAILDAAMDKANLAHDIQNWFEERA